MFEGLVPFNRRENAVSRKNDLWNLRTLMDDFFNDQFFRSALTDTYSIRTDIRETEKEYVIEAEVPGVKKEDIKLDLKDDVLTIGVEHKEETNEEKKGYIRKERRYGAYSRSFNVQNIKQDAIEAKYEDGVLTVILPKTDGQKQNQRKIDVQ